MPLFKLVPNSVYIATVTGTGSAQDVTHPFKGIPSKVDITNLETGCETTCFETISGRTAAKIVLTLVNAKTYRVTIWPPSPV